MKISRGLPLLFRASIAALAAAVLLVTLFSGTVRAQGVRAGSRTSRAITWRPEAAPLRVHEDADPPEVSIGECLFLETRFAQFFYAHFDGSVNHPLTQGGPVVSELLLSAKTPGLRDLGQSAPYLHTGRKREIEDVIDFYIDAARKAREGRLRNGAPELAGIFLGEKDVEPLSAFLRALNEGFN